MNIQRLFKPQLGTMCERIRTIVLHVKKYTEKEKLKDCYVSLSALLNGSYDCYLLILETFMKKVRM